MSNIADRFIHTYPSRIILVDEAMIFEWQVSGEYFEVEFTDTDAEWMHQSVDGKYTHGVLTESQL